MALYRIASSDVLGAGQSIISNGITDLQVLVPGADPLLVSITRAGGGLALINGATGTILQTIPISQDLLQLTPPQVSLLTLGGQAFVTVTGLREPGLFALPLSGSGGLGTPLRLTAPGQNLDLVTDLVTVTEGSAASVFASLRGTGLLRLDHLGTTQFQAQPVAISGAGSRHTISDMLRVTTGGESFLITASATADAVGSYRITEAGTLEQTGEISAGQGLGIDAPTALAAVSVGGVLYVIAAGSLSSSLTVFAVEAGGALRPVDHVIDDLNTRFHRVDALTTVTVGDRNLVIAGGGDDGVSVFLLLPGGRLLHQDSFADTLTATLGNVSALAAHQAGAALIIHAAGEREAGITRLNVPLGLPGQTQIGTAGHDALTGGAADDILTGGSGNDTLLGGAGRDILMDGQGSDWMTGGSGADIFVLSGDGQPDIVTDFQPGQDRLDLSGWEGLSSASQLQIAPQPWGAVITFRSEVLELRSASGGILRAADVLWAPVLAQSSIPLPSLSAPPLLDGRIRGTGGNDTLNGTLEADLIDGGGGNDRILGLAGADLLQGGAGNDIIFGGDGPDTAQGGIGNDRINGDGGDDLLNGEIGRDSLFGGAGRDTLFGGEGDDSLFGDDGDDLLAGDTGADVMDGGQGADIYMVDPQDRISDQGRQGTDVARIASDQGVILTLNGWSGIEQVEGGSGPDVIEALGYGQAIRLLGMAGDDLLTGSGLDDWLSGGAGNDRLAGAAGNDTLLGGDGDDTLIGWTGTDVMDGGEGSDLYMVDASDRILDSGTGGEDRAQIFETTGVRLDLANWRGIERVMGFTGNDTLDASGAPLGLYLFGERGDDLLIGGAGHDTLSGGPGMDRFYGGDGDDMILIADAGDIIGDGGSGFDTAMIDSYLGLRLVVADLPGIEQVIGGAGADVIDGGTMRAPLRLMGGHGADVLMSGSGNDLLDGGSGHDRLGGNLGDDTLLGGDGNDSLIGWLGADVMDGGEGSDLYMVDALDRINDSGSVGFDQAQVYQTDGVALRVAGWTGIERVNGFIGNDTIEATGATVAFSMLGQDGNDLLRGGSGNDTLFGGNGADRLEGSDGDDFLAGADGNDTILGGNGADILVGWLGADWMDGGTGGDLYMVDAGDILQDSGADGYDRAQVYQETGVRLDLSLWRGIERVNGFLGADTLDASRWTDPIFLHGERGNDLLLGGAGNDTLSGGAGNDTLIGGAGNEWLVGDAGMDHFVFRAGFGRDVIAGFEQGMDRIDFSGHVGLRGFSDLRLTQFRTDTLIRTSPDSPDLLIILGVDALRLGESDFIF